MDKCVILKHYDNYEIELGSELDIYHIAEDRNEVLTNIGFLPLDYVRIETDGNLRFPKGVEIRDYE